MSTNLIYFSMKLKVFIILLFSSTELFAQSLCRTDIMNGEKIVQKNQQTKFTAHDFSTTWLKTDDIFVYGVIGAENQRILIKILTVKKDDIHPNEYLVKGKSSVKGNICDFKGKIVIQKIQESIRTKFGVDNEFEGRSKTQGLLTARYEFFEDKKQKHSGFFIGELKTKWYLNERNKIQYDDINAHSDGYFNNAFVGSWKVYDSNLIKRCNWGDFRVPNINCDFDIGTAEFNIAEKYWDKGWLDVALKNKMPNGSAVEANGDKTDMKWWKYR